MSWLGHDMRGASVLATARLHIKAQQAIARVLPPALASACRVTKLDGQRLQLAVPTPAHAAKIRQLGPSMGRALAEQGWNLNTIDVTVQGSLQQINAAKVKPPKEAVPLGVTAIAAFEQLHGTLNPGPLADAVARLLTHHKPSGTSQM